MQYLIDHPEIRHGTLRIAFTPDEEIGRGAETFDVKKFACDWAYTVDGGEVGELEYENFNAALAKIYIKGLNVHPGYAKNKMLNANAIALRFAGMLPQQQRPEFTEGYEGFFHLVSIASTVEEAVMTYIIRDFDQENFTQRLHCLQEITDSLNTIYPQGTVKMEIKEQFHNMREIIEPQKHIVDLAAQAMKEV
jgi:tripeptide aminopeptidase